jgi:hypothetical protein
MGHGSRVASRSNRRQLISTLTPKMRHVGRSRTGISRTIVTEGNQLHTHRRVAVRSRPCKQRLTSGTSISEYVWLCESHRSMSAKNQALRQSNREQNIPTTLTRGRTWLQIVQRPPRLVPLFPVGSYTPHSQCAHRGPIERGSFFCCMVCHASGQDDHPSLQHTYSVELRSEAKRESMFPSSKYSDQKLLLETRKQRRQRLFSGILSSLRA